jgi:hypothetical protein
LEPESFSLEEIDETYEYSRACVVEDDRRSHIEATKLLFLIERGEHDAALRHAHGLIERGIKFREQVLADARQLIAHAQAELVKQSGSPNESKTSDDSR